LDALEALVRAGNRYAKGGIEIHFLNNKSAGRIVRVRRATASALNRFAEISIQDEREFQQLRSEIRQPNSDTYSPIGDVLDEHLRKYMRMLREAPGVKGRNFIVITDGAPSKSPRCLFHVLAGVEHLKIADAPEDVIAAAANFLEKNNYSLVQVLGLFCASILESNKLTQFLHLRPGYSLSRLATTLKRQSSWNNWIRTLLR
jgi:hypothetical protein